MKLLIIIGIILTFELSCVGQVNSDTLGFQKEIPTWRNGEPDLFYQLVKQKVKQLKIDTLQSGYDSLQIRIWYDYSLLTLRKLLILSRANSKWTATINIMSVDWDPYKLTDSVMNNKVEILSPKNGWNKLMNNLFDLQIATLPNMDDIDGLEDNWTDGITYNIEFATKKQYRFYSYHLPDKFQDKYWQAKNMVNILKLVEAEFGVTWNKMRN